MQVMAGSLPQACSNCSHNCCCTGSSRSQSTDRDRAITLVSCTSCGSCSRSGANNSCRRFRFRSGSNGWANVSQQERGSCSWRACSWRRSTRVWSAGAKDAKSDAARACCQQLYPLWPWRWRWRRRDRDRGPADGADPARADQDCGLAAGSVRRSARPTGPQPPARHRGWALPGMQLLGQQGQLLTPPRGTTARHAGVLIPVEVALDGAQELGFPQMRAQPLPGRYGGRHPVRAAGPTLTSMSAASVAKAMGVEPPWNSRVRPWHASFADQNSPGSCLTDGPVAVEVDLSPATPEG